MDQSAVSMRVRLTNRKPALHWAQTEENSSTGELIGWPRTNWTLVSTVRGVAGDHVILSSQQCSVKVIVCSVYLVTSTDYWPVKTILHF